MLRRGAGLFLGLYRVDIHPSTRAIKAHISINQRKNRIIATETDILSRQKFSAALADNDVPGNDQLASKSLHPKSLADAVAAILDAALSFFMSHGDG